jgi:predicted small integral membrane protein
VASVRARESCLLAIRLAKIFCTAAIGFDGTLVAFGSLSDYWTNFRFVTDGTLVAFGNLSDYWTNFRFVTEVLDMDDVPASSRIHWRAVTLPLLTHASYILIIGTEIAVAALNRGGRRGVWRVAGARFRCRAKCPSTRS